MKKIIRNICILIVFAAALCLIHTGLLNLTKDRGLGGERTFKSFYAQDKDSIDVIFCGSSRVFWNINPAVLWREYGIASFDLASSGEPLRLTYYSVKEALKTQSPKLMVVEVSQAENHERTFSIPESAKYLAGLKMSPDRLKLIASLEDKNAEDVSEALLLLPLFHSRYDIITKDSVVGTKEPRYPLTGAKGYKGGNELFSEGYDEATEPEKVDGSLANEDIKYLDLIRKECEDKGVPLLFLYTPKAGHTYYTGTDDYMKETGADYYNMIPDMDAMEIDIHADFVDPQHLNAYGADKATAYLGKYLTEHYDLPTHDREDPAYLSWQENAAYSQQMRKDAALCVTNGLGTYFYNFPDENYLLVISLAGNYDAEDQGQMGLLQMLGINEDSYHAGGTWVINGSSIIKYIPAGTSETWYTDIGHRTVSVEADGDGRKIYFDAEDCTVKDEDGDPKANGIEVIVYDKLAEHVTDAVFFDADAEYGIVRPDRKHVFNEEH